MKYIVGKMKTTSVVLARVAENGDLAGKEITAADCKKMLGEEFDVIKKRECPPKYKSATVKE